MARPRGGARQAINLRGLDGEGGLRPEVLQARQVAGRWPPGQPQFRREPQAGNRRRGAAVSRAKGRCAGLVRTGTPAVRRGSIGPEERMTPDEWEAAAEPQQLLRFVREKASDR